MPGPMFRTLPAWLAAVLGLWPWLPALASAEIRLSGFVQAEAARLDSAADGRLEDQAQLRRARLALRLNSGRGTLLIDRDLHNESWADVTWSWRGQDGAHWRLGHFRPAIGHEERSSVRRLAFAERSQIGALTTGRRLGLEWSRDQPGGVLALNAFGDGIEGEQRGRGLGAQWLAVLGSEAGRVRQLGIAVQQEHSQAGLRLRGRAPTRLDPATRLDSGLLDEVGRLRRFAFEGLVTQGGLELLYEQALLHPGASAPLQRARARSLQASWWFGGEARRWQRGHLQSPVLAPGAVALQLSGRVQDLELDPRAPRGGRQQIQSLALTGWLHEGSRLHLEFGRDRVSTQTRTWSRALGLRLELGF